MAIATFDHVKPKEKKTATFDHVQPRETEQKPSLEERLQNLFDKSENPPKEDDIVSVYDPNDSGVPAREMTYGEYKQFAEEETRKAVQENSRLRAMSVHEGRLHGEEIAEAQEKRFAESGTAVDNPLIPVVKSAISRGDYDKARELLASGIGVYYSQGQADELYMEFIAAPGITAEERLAGLAKATKRIEAEQNNALAKLNIAAQSRNAADIMNAAAEVRAASRKQGQQDQYEKMYHNLRDNPAEKAVDDATAERDETYAFAMSELDARIRELEGGDVPLREAEKAAWQRSGELYAAIDYTAPGANKAQEEYLSAQEEAWAARQAVLANEAQIFYANGLKTLAGLSESDRMQLIAYIRGGEYKETYKRLKSSVNKDDFERMVETVAALENSVKSAERDLGTVRFANEHPVMGSIASVFTSLVGGVSAVAGVAARGIDNLGESDGYKAPIDVNSLAFAPTKHATVTRGTISENIEREVGGTGGKVASFLYQTGMSGVDSLAASFTGNWGGALLLGTSSASNAFLDAKERGVSDSQAIWTGLFAGAFETLFERVSIGNLNALKETPVSAIKDILKNVGKSALVNASEEAFTEAATAISDYLINGDLSVYGERYNAYLEQYGDEQKAKEAAMWDMLKDIGIAGAGGLVMGVGMSGAVGGINYARGNSAGAGNGRALHRAAVAENAPAKPFAQFANGESGVQTAVSSANTAANPNGVQGEKTAPAANAIERMAATVGSEGAKTLRGMFTEAEGDEIGYVERVLPLYNAGKAGKIVNVDALSRAEQAMYNAGLIDAKVEAAKVNATAASAPVSAPAATVTATPYKVDMTVPRGEVNVDKDVKMSRAQVRQLKALAKNTNTAVTVGGHAPVDANGNQTRGWYVEDDGHIHVYADAKVVVHTKNGARTLEGGSAAVMVVAGHEFTHRLKTLNAEGYKRFANFALDKMGGYAESLAREKGWSRPKAEEEAVCDFAMQFVFSDEQTVREITRTDSKLAALAREIIEKIRELLHLNGEGNRNMLLMMEEAAKIWKSAYDEAVENVKNGKNGIYEASTVKDSSGNTVAETDGNGGIKLSESTYDAEGRDYLEKWLSEAVQKGDLDQTDATDIVDSLARIYDTMQKFHGKYASYDKWRDAEVIRDEDGNPLLSVIKENGEYAMNLDFSLVCKKRRALDAVLGELIRRGTIGNFNLNEQGIATINNIIKRRGLEIACDICFVDAKRYRQGKVADQFADVYNNLVRSLVKDKSKISSFNFVTGDTDVGITEMADGELDFSKIDKIIASGKTRTVPYKVATLLKEHPEYRKLVSRGDFMNSQGFTAVKRQAPEVLKLYNSKKGSGGPKASFGDVQYLNDVLKDNRFYAEAAYSVGGVRLQSFSDYVARLVFDYAQEIADLSAKKLPAHAYTKEALFAKQFGLTGIKINLSLIPMVVDGGVAPGLDANGNYAWADESFDFDTAVEIENAEGYRENCGTIAVGVSKAHIEKLLSDPNIRMIIPYHKSSLNPFVAKMRNIAAYTDYTKVQSTRDSRTGKKLTDAQRKSEPNFNDLLREHGDPKAAAQAYLDWCEENGYIPKFDEFAGNENYYKLLTDFAVYDQDGTYHPQGAVTMSYPDADSAFGDMKSLIESGLAEDQKNADALTSKLSSIVDEIEATLPAAGVDFEMKRTGVGLSLNMPFSTGLDSPATETKNTAESGVKYSESGSDAEMFSNEDLEKNENLDYNKNIKQSIKTQKGYTEKQYRDYGWARENDILNEGQNEDYRSKFADAVTGRAKFPKSKAGEHIIPVSDIYDAVFEGVNNVLVFAKGTITDPIITSVIHIYEYDETSIDKVRRRIYELERRGIQQEAGEFFGRYYATDFEMQHEKDVFQIGRHSDGNGHGGRSGEETSSVDGKITAIDGDVQHSTSGNDADLLASVYEAREVWKRAKKMTPMQIANMQLSAVDPLPKVEPRKPSGVNAENGKESKFYGSAMRSDNVFDETRDLIESMDDVRYYYGISNEETLNEANDRLNLKGQTEANHFFAMNPAYADATDIAEGFILLKRYQDKGDFETAAEVARKLREMGTSAGQTVQAFSILGRLTPEGMAIYAQKELDQIREEMIRKHSEAWVLQRKEMFQLTAEEMEKIQQNMILASALPDGRDKTILIAEIASMLEAKLPTTVLRMIKAWTRNCMLLNPKTMLRNVIGNAIMMPAYAVDDFVGAGLDRLLAKKSGVRTKGATFVNKDNLRAFGKGVYESYDDFRRNVNTRQAEGDRFELGQGNDFHYYTLEQRKAATPGKRAAMELSNALNKVDRVTGWLLDMGDRPFFEAHFVNSINNQCRLNGVTEPTAEMVDIATTEALQRTWQDDNGYTKFVQNVRNGLNFGKSWGLGSIIVPFTKTPANLTKALIEYSPVGLVKSIAWNGTKYKQSVKIGKPDVKLQKAFVDSFAKGVTGTLTMALGLLFAHLDWISGGDDDEDKDVAQFKRNIMGIAPYSVKVNGISYTYDWAQPIGGLFAISADVIKNIRNGNGPTVAGLDVLGTAGNAILDALSAGGNVLFEQSFLQGIADLFGNDNLMSGLIEAATGVTSQFVPTALGQIAQMCDPYVRTSFYYDNTLASAGNKAVAKIPGARNTLAPVVDVLGHEVESFNAPLNVMFNPSNMYAKTATEAAMEIYRVYEATGDATVVPRVAPYYLKHKGEKYEFTPHERAEYQRVMGSTNEAIVTDLLKSKGYAALSAEARAQVLVLATDYATAEAKYTYLGEQGVKYERDSWMVKAAEGTANGVSVADFLVAKAAISAIKSGLKDADGETIDNSESLLKMEAIYAIDGLTDSKRKYLFEALGVGKSVRHYNKACVSAELAKMRKKAQ